MIRTRVLYRMYTVNDVSSTNIGCIGSDRDPNPGYRLRSYYPGLLSCRARVHLDVPNTVFVSENDTFEFKNSKKKKKNPDTHFLHTPYTWCGVFMFASSGELPPLVFHCTVRQNENHRRRRRRRRRASSSYSRRDRLIVIRSVAQ